MAMAMDLKLGTVFKWQAWIYVVLDNNPDENGNIQVRALASTLYPDRYTLLHVHPEKFNGYAEDIELGKLVAVWQPEQAPKQETCKWKEICE